MALVVNTRQNPAPLSSGRTLAYGADPVNVDPNLPLEAQQIASGVLRVVDANVTPPAPARTQTALKATVPYTDSPAPFELPITALGKIDPVVLPSGSGSGSATVARVSNWPSGALPCSIRVGDYTGSTITNSDGTETGRTYSYIQRLAFSAHDIRLVYVIKKNAPNPVTVKASLYTYGASLQPVFFGGKRTSPAVEPGSFIVSDPVPFSYDASVAGGPRELMTLTYVSVDTLGKKWPLGYQMGIGGTQYANLMEGSAAGDQTDTLNSGLPAVSADSGFGFGPTQIIAQPASGTTAPHAVAGIGDSILYGYIDSITPGGWLQRSLKTLPTFANPYDNPLAAYVNLALPGGTNNSFRASDMQLRLIDGCDRAVVAYGVNEVQAGQSFANTRDQLNAVNTMLRDRGVKKIAYANLTPLPAVTQAKADVRAAINDWSRSQPAGWDVLLDVAAATETAVNSNAYKSGMNSGDNVHPSTSGHAAIVTGVAAGIAALLS